VIRPDGAVKLTGRAIFGTDLSDEGMAFAALVLAPVAHGRIRSLNLDAVRGRPGVLAVVGPDEVAALVARGTGTADRPLFPREEIRYRSEPIAAVAARSLAAARSAAAAVTAEIEPLAPVLDVEEVVPEWPDRSMADSPHVNAHVLARHGDLAAAFAAADFVHAETYRTSGVHQVALEPHACLARVEGDRWHVQTTTQAPFGVREDAASLLGLREDQLTVEGTWVGGGFGGKAASFLEPYALLLASATGRPVKLALTYREEFLLGRSTLPAVFRLETALQGGRITARRARMLLDSGASLPGRDFATGYAIGFLLGPYRVGAFEMEGYAIRTNKPPFGPHRAPLAPQCVFAAESHMDSIARRLGVDPIEFRLQHAWREGDTTPLGQPVGPFGLVEGLERARRQRDRWRSERAADEGVGYGLGSGFWATGTSAGGEATVELRPDGLVIVQGEREIGNGSVIAGLGNVAERRLGLAREHVRVEYRDTAHAPYDSGVFGSRTVGALGQAVEKAARTIQAKLTERLRAPEPVRLSWKGGEVVVESGDRAHPLRELLSKEEAAAGGLRARGRHFGRPSEIDDTRVVDGTFYPYMDFTSTVALAEVRVDRTTGGVTPLRIASFPDVGVALDPALITAQVEGGVAMGLGTALTEEMLWGPAGRLLNPDLLDYRIPTLGEVPPIAVDLVEGFPGAGPYGAKGVGEPPIIPVPAAVANAVADAIGARVYELPLTGERVARALKLL
jgi:CO/xanthine dehydrogenase Mo-binding subunit